eukprot:GEZU01033020.1.p1 GENE.GEZU01033020.1~~GEZU01033020.1.p1  ORF type:complete len:170 (+),score=25.12 GEZU01033020.1:28-537(+)
MMSGRGAGITHPFLLITHLFILWVLFNMSSPIRGTDLFFDKQHVAQEDEEFAAGSIVTSFNENQLIDRSFDGDDVIEIAEETPFATNINRNSVDGFFHAQREDEVRKSIEDVKPFVHRIGMQQQQDRAEFLLNLVTLENKHYTIECSERGYKVNKTCQPVQKAESIQTI